MTPEFKIKKTILLEAVPGLSADEITEDNIDEMIENNQDRYDNHAYDFSGGEFSTELISNEYSRHYECEFVAAKMFDGSYVGWTKWYGGGKHGDPDSIPWMDSAEELESWEETVVVKKFKRK